MGHALRLAQYAQDGICNRCRIACRKQDARIVIAYQLSMPAYIRREHHPAERHRLQRLERRNEFGQSHRAARIDHRVRHAVIAGNIVIRDAAREDDLVLNIQRLRERAKVRFFGTPTCKQDANIRPIGEDRRKSG